MSRYDKQIKSETVATIRARVGKTKYKLKQLKK